MLQHPVFHIRTACASSVDGITALLDKAGVRADECDDVYRGLARLCVQRDAPTQIVLVGVDDLTEDELEFFHLMRRSCGDLQVYVYGGERFEDRIASVIRQGATGRFHEQVLQNPALRENANYGEIAELNNELSEGALSEPSSSTPDAIVDPLESEPTATQPIPGETGPANLDFVDEEREAATEPRDHTTDDHDEEDDEQTIVRVPWLRRDDAPTRQRPTDTARPPDSGIGQPQGERSAADSSQPLLTDDELRALIGDGDPGESWMDSNELDHESDGTEELRS